MSAETTSGGQGGGMPSPYDWEHRDTSDRWIGARVSRFHGPLLFYGTGAVYLGDNGARSLADYLRSVTEEAPQPTPAREAPTDDAALVEELTAVAIAAYLGVPNADPALPAREVQRIERAVRAVAGRARREALEEAARWLQQAANTETGAWAAALGWAATHVDMAAGPAPAAGASSRRRVVDLRSAFAAPDTDDTTEDGQA